MDVACTDWYDPTIRRGTGRPSRDMIDDLTFLHSDHRSDCIATVDKRFGYHTLQYAAQGGIELFYDQERHEVTAPVVWPCFPGPWIRFHEWPHGHAWDHRYIAFRGPRVAEWEASGLWPLPVAAVERADASALNDLFDEMIDLAMRPGRWPRVRAINLLERIVLERAEAAAASVSAHPRWLGEVMTQLATAREVDYARVARAANMSLTTLRRRFRSATGQSLHDYRLEHRVGRARRLLGDSDLPIKVIADRLGYLDVSYFSRQFKQFSGVSPAAYRRSSQR